MIIILIEVVQTRCVIATQQILHKNVNGGSKLSYITTKENINSVCDTACGSPSSNKR